VTYNPNAPDTIGVEWWPTTVGEQVLDTQTKNVAFSLASTATETIDQLIIPQKWAGSGTGYGRTWVDVYDLASSPVAGAITELAYSPNADVSPSNITGYDTGTGNLSSPWYPHVDELVDSSDTDWIYNSNSQGAGSIRFEFNSAGIPTTWRIAYVRMEVTAFANPWAYGAATMTVEYWANTTKIFDIATVEVPTDEVFRTYSFGPWYNDFYNDGPWLQPAIAGWDTAGGRHFGFSFVKSVAVSRVTIYVGVVTENRVAVGVSSKITTAPSGVQTNQPLLFKTPLGTDNWAKTTAKNYLFVTRRVDDPFGLTPSLTPKPVSLDAGVLCPHACVPYTATIDQAGLISTYATSGTKTFAAVLGTSGGVQSVDSQPYHTIDRQPVHATSTLKQGVNAASAQAYKRVRFLAATNGTPNANMSIKLKKVSDNSQVGGTATMTAANLTDTSISRLMGSVTLGGFFYLVYDVTINLASTATLAAATNYYLEFTSSSTSPPWYVVWLDGTATHSLTGNATYGGSTNVADVNGATTAAADFPAVLGSTPTAPTALTCTATNLVLTGGTMQFARVAFTSGGSLSTKFARWELERSEDSGTTWVPVAKLLTEADVDFDDYESSSSVALKYRVRVVRTDGAVSDWFTQSGTTTLTTPAGMMVFASNATPALTCGYTVEGGGTTFKFRNADDTVFMEFHGRDYQVAFKPLEQRGASWGVSLIVRPGGSATPAGLSAFTALRAIADAGTLGYVCVRTQDGERFFGAIQVADGSRMEPSHLYTARVAFTQTQSAGSVVSI
jgi:hypothetical protein